MGSQNGFDNHRQLKKKEDTNPFWGSFLGTWTRITSLYRTQFFRLSALRVRRRRLEGVSRSPGMSHFADSVKGARTIRAFGHEAREPLRAGSRGGGEAGGFKIWLR